VAANGVLKPMGLPFVTAELGSDWFGALIAESLASAAAAAKSILRWARALLAGFCTGDPKEIWDASFTRLDVNGPPTVSSGLNRWERLSSRS
jgi:hypothetical protein